MVQFLYKAELLFDESLVSALLGNSFKFKVFHVGVVCWQEIDNMFRGARSQDWACFLWVSIKNMEFNPL